MNVVAVIHNGQLDLAEATEGGAIQSNVRHVPTRYTDHGTPTGIAIDPAARAAMKLPAVTLIWARVRVSPHTIEVISPAFPWGGKLPTEIKSLPRVARMLAENYTKNWTDRAFVALASDADLASAMASSDEPTNYAAMTALREKMKAAV